MGMERSRQALEMGDTVGGCSEDAMESEQGPSSGSGGQWADLKSRTQEDEEVEVWEQVLSEDPGQGCKGRMGWGWGRHC